MSRNRAWQRIVAVRCFAERVAAFAIRTIEKSGESIPNARRLKRFAVARRDISAHHFCDAHRVFIGTFENDEARRGLTVVATHNLLVRETLDDLRDIPNRDNLPA